VPGHGELKKLDSDIGRKTKPAMRGVAEI
jgi:hypothetical protein